MSRYCILQTNSHIAITYASDECTRARDIKIRIFLNTDNLSSPSSSDCRISLVGDQESYGDTLQIVSIRESKKNNIPSGPSIASMMSSNLIMEYFFRLTANDGRI